MAEQPRGGKKSVNLYGFKYTGDMHQSIANAFKDVDPYFTGKRKFSSVWRRYTEEGGIADSEASDYLEGPSRTMSESFGQDFRRSAVVKMEKIRDANGKIKKVPTKVTFKTYKRPSPETNEGLDDPKGELVEKKSIDIVQDSDHE